jgi:hypothetical protein
MYGFQDEKLLSWLVGRELEQIGIGAHEVTFNFYPAGRMTVTGRWELYDPGGQVIDHSMEHAGRTQYRLHHLIGPTVSKVVVESETAMTMSFANGFRLRVLDDDPRYEALVADPGDGQIILVV